jgi:tetratricopeptide (TPR) repeat protein
MTKMKVGQKNKPKDKASEKASPIEATNVRPADVSVRPAFIGLALAAVTLAVFWPVVYCNFINCDDPNYFTTNSQVLAGLTRGSVGWAFSTIHMGYWQPLTWLSFMLDVTLFGRGPAGPHLMNLLFHAANTVLLFQLLRRLTGATWRSAFVAALFALHPLRVESVAWVTERKDVLSTFFGLLSLLFYVRYVQKPEVRSQKSEARIWSSDLRPLTSGLYWLSLFFFACGLMSKPMLVTLPCVMLLLDYWPLKRISDFLPHRGTISDFNHLLVEKIPFFLLSVVVSVVTFLAQRAVGAVPTLTILPVPSRLGNAVVSYARYLGKMVWPVDLATPYPLVEHWDLSVVVMATMLVLGLCVGALWLGRKRPFLFTGWFWFFGMLIPVIGLVQSGQQSMADRFTYVPLIGMFLVMVWGACELFQRWPATKVTVVIAGVVMLGACAALTRHQLSYWRNGGALFGHTVAVTRDNWFANQNFGCYLVAQGRVDEAIKQFRAGLHVATNDPDLLGDLAYALGNKKRQYAEAVPFYEAALRGQPDNLFNRHNYAEMLSQMGKTDEMIVQYRELLRRKPADAQIHNDLGIALAKQGKLDEADTQLQAALCLKPDAADFHCNLGNVLTTQGKYAEAIAQYHEALRLDPHYAHAENNLGSALEEEGQTGEALRHYQAAVRLDARYAVGRFNLGCLLAKVGRRDEAVAQLQEALRLQPDYPEAKQKLDELNTQSPH